MFFQVLLLKTVSIKSNHIIFVQKRQYYLTPIILMGLLVWLSIGIIKYRKESRVNEPSGALQFYAFGPAYNEGK